MKTNKEVIDVLVKTVLESASSHMGGNFMMLSPALNILKLKIRNMDESDADYIVDAVHKISRQIEIETGKGSPYHRFDDDLSNTLARTA